MAQTPAQRRANEKFAKVNEKRMGKAEATYKKKDAPKSPIGPVVVGLLIFVVIAPLAFELLKLFPQAYDLILGLLSTVGLVSR